MRTVAFFIIFVVTGSVALHAHPIHVSVANLDFHEDTNLLEFSVKLYYDDFQSLINYKYNTLLNFATQSRIPTSEQSAIIDYLGRNFMIVVNNDTLVTKFTSWKVETGSVWLFFCASLPDSIREIKIEDRLMLDLFSDQTNLVIANLFGEQQGLEFNMRETQKTLFAE
jgi:hypothetical protein